MSNKDLKDKYKEILKIVKKVVNEWDPVDLLAFDCPEDEYAIEIQRITTATLRANTVEDLAREIDDILNEFFDGDYKKSKDCFMIADKILKSF